jgi:hypothetical protein
VEGQQSEADEVITTRDDNWCRTHDEVRDLLTYAVPGARVTLTPVALPGSAVRNAGARRYEVTVPRIGVELPPTADTYTLPCRAEPLARRARELADYALRA